MFVFVCRATEAIRNSNCFYCWFRPKNYLWQISHTHMHSPKAHLQHCINYHRSGCLVIPPTQQKFLLLSPERIEFCLDRRQLHYRISIPFPLIISLSVKAIAVRIPRMRYTLFDYASAHVFWNSQISWKTTAAANNLNSITFDQKLLKIRKLLNSEKLSSSCIVCCDSLCMCVERLFWLCEVCVWECDNDRAIWLGIGATSSDKKEPNCKLRVNNVIYTHLRGIKHKFIFVVQILLR